MATRNDWLMVIDLLNNGLHVQIQPEDFKLAKSRFGLVPGATYLRDWVTLLCKDCGEGFDQHVGIDCPRHVGNWEKVTCKFCGKSFWDHFGIACEDSLVCSNN